MRKYYSLCLSISNNLKTNTVFKYLLFLIYYIRDSKQIKKENVSFDAVKIKVQMSPHWPNRKTNWSMSIIKKCQISVNTIGLGNILVDHYYYAKYTLKKDGCLKVLYT